MTDHLTMPSGAAVEEESSCPLSRNTVTSNKRVLNSDLSLTDTGDIEDDGTGTGSREVKRHQPLLPSSSSDFPNLTPMHLSETTAPLAGSCVDDHESRTLILRNIAEAATAADIVFLLSPFSKGVPAVTFLSPDEVLVEMEDSVAAERAVRYLSIHQISLKGVPVTAAMSNMPEGCLVTGHLMDAGSASNFSSKIKADPVSFRVLLVTITEIRYPVDIDLLHRLFCVYGMVEKIVTFVKNSNRHQALIQFASPREAREASNVLNNKCIFDGCNKIQIQSSKLSQLVVKQNNEKSWDFTVSPMSKTHDKASVRSSISGVIGGLPSNDYGHFPTAGSMLPPISSPSGYSPQAHHPMMASMPNGPSSLTGHPQHHLSCGPSAPPSSGSLPQHQSVPPQLMDKLPRELQNYTTLHQINPMQSSVIICYNLPAANITVPKLFNLLSLYGVVLRIKLLREKPDTALAQYSHPLYATLACHYLANAPFFGSDTGLQIGISKKTEVKLPPPTGVAKDAVEEAKRTMAFQAQDQRAKPEEVEKFIRGACKPTNTLFVANIHESVDEKVLRDLLSTVGTVVKLQLRPPKQQAKRVTAMVEMSSEKEALSAICHLHNTQMGGCNLKFAFSKQVLGKAQ